MRCNESWHDDATIKNSWLIYSLPNERSGRCPSAMETHRIRRRSSGILNRARNISTTSLSRWARIVDEVTGLTLPTDAAIPCHNFAASCSLVTPPPPWLDTNFHHCNCWTLCACSNLVSPDLEKRCERDRPGRVNCFCSFAGPCAHSRSCVTANKHARPSEFVPLHLLDLLSPPLVD